VLDGLFSGLPNLGLQREKGGGRQAYGPRPHTIFSRPCCESTARARLSTLENCCGMSSSDRRHAVKN